MIRIFCIAVVLSLMATFAFAMDTSLKEKSLQTTKFCTVYNECCSDRGSATYLWTDAEGYSYWVTDVKLVGGMPRVSVDVYPATMIATSNDLAILRAKYDPTMVPTTFGYYSFLDEGMYYSNLCKWNTVNKMNVKSLDAFRMVCNTTPNCVNRGAGVFNLSGDLVGVVIGRYEGSCCLGWGTEIALLDRQLIETLQEDYPSVWY